MKRRQERREQEERKTGRRFFFLYIFISLCNVLSGTLGSFSKYYENLSIVVFLEKFRVGFLSLRVYTDHWEFGALLPRLGLSLY